MVFGNLRVGYVEVVVVIGCRGISEGVVPSHVHTVVLAAELKQIPSVCFARVADNISGGDTELLHTVLESVSVTRADCYPEYNRAVSALIIRAARDILNGVREIIVNELDLLHILGKRRGEIYQRVSFQNNTLRFGARLRCR